MMDAQMPLVSRPSISSSKELMFRILHRKWRETTAWLMTLCSSLLSMQPPGILFLFLTMCRMWMCLQMGTTLPNWKASPAAIELWRGIVSPSGKINGILQSIRVVRYPKCLAFG